MDTRRIVDVSVAVAGLAVTALPLMFAMAAIAVTMREPPLFRQTRHGLNGKLFTVYKIRTMTSACDKKGRLLPDEKRLTWVGSCLRRRGLDELPQLWNIAKGDMSIIGPRPMHHEENIQGGNRRYQIKPGLIGLNQIRRKEAGDGYVAEIRLHDDLEYIARRNLWLDLRLIARAAMLIIAGRVDVQQRHVHVSFWKARPQPKL